MSGEPLPPYQNNARIVIECFVNSSKHTDLAPHAPNKKMVVFAEQTLKAMKFGQTSETLFKIAQGLTDFDGDNNIVSGICTTTDLMTYLFLKEKGRLPKNWQSDEGRIRTIISMAANLDIAELKNNIIHTQYDDDLSSPQKRTDIDIDALEKLV